jgi:hypothetical protein
MTVNVNGFDREAVALGKFYARAHWSLESTNPHLS